MSGRAYDVGPGFVRAKECPDCLHTKCGEGCTCNCDAARTEDEAAQLLEQRNALLAACSLVELAVLTIAVLDAQRVYFSSRRQKDLIECKKLEKDLRAAASEVLERHKRG